MNSEKLQKLKMHKLLAVLIMAVGIVLLVFMVSVESEPGAIPLLMIISGTGWYFVTRYKLRKQSL